MIRYDFLQWKFNDILFVCDQPNILKAEYQNLIKDLINDFKRNVYTLRTWTDEEIWFIILKDFSKNFEDLHFNDIEYWKTHNPIPIK